MTVLRLLITFSCLILVACSSREIQDDNYLARSSFISKYNSTVPIPFGARFNWAESKSKVYADERLPADDIAGMLRKSIAHELTTRGIQFTADNTKSDYSVVYIAALRSDLDDTTILHQYGIQPGLIEHRINPKKLEKGSVIIELIDNKTNKLYWRSIGQAFANLEQVPLEQRSHRVSVFVNILMQDLAKASAEGSDQWGLK